MLEELTTVRTETVQVRKGQRALVLLVALAVLVGIGLGGRWILTQDDPLTVQGNSAHISYVGRDDRLIYLSLDLQPVANGSDDPIRLEKAQLLPAAGDGRAHWIRVVDVRAMEEGTSASAASGLWPEGGGEAGAAPEVAGYTLPPGGQVRLLFVVQLPDLERTDDVRLSMSRTWSRVRVTYEQGGDSHEAEARTSIEVCIPNVAACQSN